MGHQHLIRALVLGLGLVACGRSEPTVPRPPPVSAQHVQFVAAMKTHERLALVERLRERNGPEWTVNEDALLRSNSAVDPFARFVRRARSSKTHPPAPVRIDEAAAVDAARAFVRKNADLLGVPPSLVLTLLVEVQPSIPGWTVLFEASFPTKGYESFEDLANEVSIDVTVDDDGTISSFVNRSKLHPRLVIDTHPGLPETDSRVWKHVLGRRVFALTEDGKRIELGELDGLSPIEAKVAVQVTRGPLDAWLTYRLTWRLVLARMSPSADDLGFYFFYYLVDTDTGEVVQDSPVPTRVLSEMP